MTFDELQNISEPRTIEIKGFCYRDSNGYWIIDERPNLRSCCVGTESNIKRQVVVDDEIAGLDNNILVHLKGTISVRPEYKEGKLVSYYHIAQTELIDNPFAWGSLIVVIGVVALIAFIFNLGTKKPGAQN